MMEDDNKMESLYNRFKKELKETSKSSYYDEQDIVDIFDFAGDVHDDYIRLEALLLGNRLFPDSLDLLKRHAIFLSDISEEAFAAFMASANPPQTDVMWAILKCRAQMPMGDSAIAALESILATYTLEEDEETIQFVNLAKQLQQEQWLTDNLDYVRSRVTYIPTLLYEIARIAESDRQIAVSIKLLEELTMLDPFNTDYWGLLAELQSSTDRLDDALSSLDYAKALSPNDHELLSLEGYIKLKQGKAAEAIPVLEKVLSISPDNYSAKRNLAEAYKQIDDVADAKPIIKQLFENDPTDAALMMDLLYCEPESLDETLSRFHASSTDQDETSTLQRIGVLCLNGRLATALQYIDWYKAKYELSQTGKFALLELLYINEKFDEAYDFIMANCRKLILEPNELPVVSIIASTLIRHRDFESAKTFCNVWVERLANIPVEQNAYRLVTRGLLDTLRDMQRFLEVTPEPTDEQIHNITL